MNCPRRSRSVRIEVRRRAALVLGDLGDKSGVEVMIKDLTTPELRQRQNVAVALLILNDWRAIPTWRQALKDRSPYIRGRALAALGNLKAGVAFVDIVAHIQDRGCEQNCMALPVGCTACDVLVTLGNRRAVPYLIRALNDKGVSSFVAQAAAHALGALTNQPFGYDYAKWKAWWAESGRAKYN